MILHSNISKMPQEARLKRTLVRHQDKLLSRLVCLVKLRSNLTRPSKQGPATRAPVGNVMCAQGRRGLMKRFSFGLGVLCIIYACLYFLGLLPVGFWQSIIDLVMGREPGEYYKVVPAE